jgi:hypothetical protein
MTREGEGGGGEDRKGERHIDGRTFVHMSSSWHTQ